MSSDSMLQVNLQHRVGALQIDVSFELRQPWTILFGPSGSGKTTVLRALAGFIQPDTGRILSGKKVLFDRAAGVSIPAHARPIRSVGQSSRLFPHISVLKNLAYGIARPDHSAPSSIVDDAVERFQLGPLTHRTVAELSGGERQRIAITRAAIAAISVGPKTVLLLDEPFTGFDVPRREKFAGELSDWLRQMEIPVLSVTHDVGEAFQSGAEIIKIAEGRIIGQGPVSEVLAEERTRLLQQLGKDFSRL